MAWRGHANGGRGMRPRSGFGEEWSSVGGGPAFPSEPFAGANLFRSLLFMPGGGSCDGATRKAGLPSVIPLALHFTVMGTARSKSA